MPFPRASQALSRFTVLDLTRVRSGPTCVRQLADWGANVIKIDALLEDAGGEQPGGPRHGSDFQNLHRNKRAMTLNLKDPKGLEVFRRLAEKADVVVENFRPDVKSKLGIDYESVRKINPRIVYGSISGFGQDGPYRDRAGFGTLSALELAKQLYEGLLPLAAEFNVALAGGDTTIPELVTRIYAAIDKRLWPAAARQVLAYLIALEGEGRVRSERIVRPPTAQEAALLDPDLSKLGEEAGADVIRAELGFGSAEPLLRYELA